MWGVVNSVYRWYRESTIPHTFDTGSLRLHLQLVRRISLCIVDTKRGLESIHWTFKRFPKPLKRQFRNYQTRDVSWFLRSWRRYVKIWNKGISKTILATTPRIVDSGESISMANLLQYRYYPIIPCVFLPLSTLLRIAPITGSAMVIVLPICCSHAYS